MTHEKSGSSAASPHPFESPGWRMQGGCGRLDRLCRLLQPDGSSRRAAGAAALWIGMALLAGCGNQGPDRRAALEARGDAPQVSVMDFVRNPPSLAALPAGWRHRTFWTRAPMTMSLGVKDGVPAIRLATDASASMLLRAVDIELEAYPLLAWRWLIERPIDSALDERTRAGDDHPARLFITFLDPAGTKHSMEVIWGNRVLHRGDYKFIGDFPHYVADGGAAQVGRWQTEQIDLLAIYRKLWSKEKGGNAAGVRVIEIGLFCDSDDTRTSSIAWFAEVTMLKRAP